MSQYVSGGLTKPWLKINKTTHFERGRRDKPRQTELRQETGRKKDGFICMAYVGRDFVSPLPNSLNPGQEVGTGTLGNFPGCL